jgi:hypothetical protein
MKLKFKNKFFPFASGISWEIDQGKYVVPKIDGETWKSVLSNKDLHIVVFGGLLESFFSFSYAEALSSLEPDKDLYWIGDDKYKCLLKVNGLCKPGQSGLTKTDLEKYPVPLFFDKEDNAYFNVLHDYKTKLSYWGQHPKENKLPILKQIYNNLMIPWNNYIPKTRSLDFSFYNHISIKNKLSHKTILIIHDEEDNALNWNKHNIREFAFLVGKHGFKVCVATHHSGMFYDSKVIAIEYDILKILQLITKSWMVLSSKIDWLFIAMMISNAHIVSKHQDGIYNLFDNAEFIGATNVIFTDKTWMSPMDVCAICAEEEK